MDVTIGISNRHIHLTENTFKMLFGKDASLTKRNDLNQPGEFASNEVLNIKTLKGTIENVRVLGPFRDYNQVEITKTDAYKLGINPPVRKSGNLKGSESVVVVGPRGEMILNESTIIAERHIHMTKEYASMNNFIDGSLVNVIIDTVKPGTILAHIKVSDKAYLEMHLDTDDANAFLLKNGDSVEIIK